MVILVRVKLEIIIELLAYDALKCKTDIKPKIRKKVHEIWTMHEVWYQLFH